MCISYNSFLILLFRPIFTSRIKCQVKKVNEKKDVFLKPHFFAANFADDEASMLYPKLDSTLEKINERKMIFMKVGAVVHTTRLHYRKSISSLNHSIFYLFKSFIWNI